ncbi:MAG: hypothetical protein ACE5GZ_14350 [Gammaproteobacteria bacterium]
MNTKISRTDPDWYSQASRYISTVDAMRAFVKSTLYIFFILIAVFLSLSLILNTSA